MEVIDFGALKVRPTAQIASVAIASTTQSIGGWKPILPKATSEPSKFCSLNSTCGT